MLHVTDRAVDKFQEMRERSGLTEDQVIALAWRDGELRFDIAMPGPDDQVIDKDGDPVVSVPLTIAEALDGAILDYDDAPERRQFTLNRP